MTTHSATLVVEPFTTTLTINHGPTRTRLNVVWVDETPEQRADELLTQNGYRRISAWVDGKTVVKADGETTACCCWQEIRDGKQVIVRPGLGCRDHSDVADLLHRTRRG